LKPNRRLTAPPGRWRQPPTTQPSDTDSDNKDSRQRNIFEIGFDPNGNIDAELPRNNFFEIGRGNRITRRCAPRPPGRRPKAAGAQLGLRPSCRTWLVLCRRFDPNGNIDAELPRNNFFEIGRGNRIRTCDPLVPNQMRYQTAPCPEPAHRDSANGAADPITVRERLPFRPPQSEFCGEAIALGFRPRATTRATALPPAASMCSCRTGRRPDRPPPSPFDCAHRERDSTP
jgi:hypothetical protein